jgi:O-methyltransferase domain/Dimerisation domain
MDHDHEDPAAALARLAGGFRAARAVQVAARLGLADGLRDGPRHPADLAAATGTHPDALGRLMRALAGLGVLASDALGRYRLTPMGELLRGDAPGSLRDFVARFGEPEYWRAWGALDHSIATGRPAFDAVFGARLFDHLARNPEAAARFHAGMGGGSARAAAAVVAALGDLGGVDTVVDVGGGHGALLAAVLRANPEARGVLFELPQVAEAGRAALAAAGLAGRSRVETGDFFEAVPAGGDLYLLQRIVTTGMTPRPCASWATSGPPCRRMPGCCWSRPWSGPATRRRTPRCST